MQGSATITLPPHVTLEVGEANRAAPGAGLSILADSERVFAGRKRLFGDHEPPVCHEGLPYGGTSMHAAPEVGKIELTSPVKSPSTGERTRVATARHAPKTAAGCLDRLMM